MKIFENPKNIKILCIITFFIAVFVEGGLGLRLMQSGNKIGILMVVLGGSAALASFGMIIILTVKKDIIKKG